MIFGSREDDYANMRSPPFDLCLEKRAGITEGLRIGLYLPSSLCSVRNAKQVVAQKWSHWIIQLYIFLLLYKVQRQDWDTFKATTREL